MSSTLWDPVLLDCYGTGCWYGRCCYHEIHVPDAVVLTSLLLSMIMFMVVNIIGLRGENCLS
jgi:hypothetical protein